MNFFGYLSVNFPCLFFVLKEAKVFIFTIHFHLSLPFACLLVPSDSLYPGHSGAAGFVPHILRVSCQPQIEFSIVYAVVVSVVHLNTIRRTNDLAVHQGCSSYAFRNSRISDCVPFPVQGPFPFIEIFKIIDINNGHASFCQWKQLEVDRMFIYQGNCLVHGHNMDWVSVRRTAETDGERTLHWA